MITINGKPNNGMIIYELIRYGKRVDYNTESMLPATSDIEKEYEEQMKRIQELKKERENNKGSRKRQYNK